MMISGFNNAIYARAGRDEDIEKVIQSVKAAGRAGLPVVEYNWYAHRAMEGYFEETGRAGAGWTGFDYERMKGLDPLPNEGAHTAGEMWNNIAYFLKAVIPEAEKAGVRMALHPNDPPAPLSRGSQQIMGSVDGWKKLIGIVNSPSNGITFDCGVTKEMGQDPVDVCAYFASRDLAKIAVIERHHATGRIGLGLVRGFGLASGAFASTVAHDAHNLVIVGTDDASMRACAERLQQIGGGIAVARDGAVHGELALPVAGLLSDAPVEDVVTGLEALQDMLREQGVGDDAPFMTLSFLALSVIPALKITDRGLVDVERFELVPLAV
jgi:hypothetical protein